MKRGQMLVTSIVVTTVIMLFIVVFYFSFFYQAKEKGISMIGDEICMQSVKAHAFQAELGTVSGKEMLGNINCPPKDIEIKEDLDTAKGQRLAKQKISLEMASCWKNCGKGVNII